MQAEILMIGTELLLGQIVDTNASFLGQTLAENGINLFQKITVGDNKDRIVRAFDAALDRSDVVLTSGGLGPTEDDITRECVAELLDRPLEFHQELMDEISARFSRMGRPLSGNNNKQAYLPRGAQAIHNPNGTAPGFLVEDERGIIMAMPGVPHELKAMMTDSFVPFLRERFGIKGVLHYRVLKVCGMGESRVDEAIGDIITSHTNPTIGLLASPDAVKIRIAAKGGDLDEANALIDGVEAKVRERLPGLIMGVDDDTVESVVDGLLSEKGWDLAVAETFTGGMIAQRFVAAGASSFSGATVYPAKEYKERDAREAAHEMAERVREQYGASCAIAVVPEPEEKRSVAVFLAPDGEHEWDLRCSPSSQRGQLRAAVIALETIRRRLTGVEDYP